MNLEKEHIVYNNLKSIVWALVDGDKDDKRNNIISTIDEAITMVNETKQGQFYNYKQLVKLWVAIEYLRETYSTGFTRFRRTELGNYYEAIVKAIGYKKQVMNEDKYEFYQFFDFIFKDLVVKTKSKGYEYYNYSSIFNIIKIFLEV